MDISTTRTIEELITKLKQYPEDTPIAMGDGSNGFSDFYISTVKDEIEKEYLEEMCEDYDVTPDTVLLVEFC